MSGNPFRRPQGNRLAEEPSYREEPSTPPRNTRGKKKKVKIQTPPHSPEDVPRRSSSGRISPPPPPPPPKPENGSDSDSDSTATADSDLDLAYLNTRRNSGSLPTPGSASGTGAPLNPFARTLATSEAALGVQRHGLDRQEEGHRSKAVQARTADKRPAMDVDTFKNILMTGNAAPSPTASASAQLSKENLGKKDRDSAFKHSSFDPMRDLRLDSPRGSFDQHYDSGSEGDEDDENSNLMSSGGRMDDLAPPAPPKGVQGRSLAPRGPQTVSFADFDNSIPTSFTPSPIQTPVGADPGGFIRPPTMERSMSDLNKPLPPPPPPESTAFEQSADAPPSLLHTSTGPTSNDPSQQKATPPPPPVSRRQGQVSTPLGRARSSSSTTQESIVDEAAPLKPADSIPKLAPPPPPPSRKTKPVGQPTLAPIATTPQAPLSTNMIPPPPRRNPSKARPPSTRTPSDASRTSSNRTDTPSAAASIAPPPAPPPRRVAGGSSAVSKRTSMDVPRHESENSLGSTFPQVAEPGALTSPSSASRDILADMSAFQAEIDALRARASKGG